MLFPNCLSLQRIVRGEALGFWMKGADLEGWTMLMLSVVSKLGMRVILPKR